MDESTDPQDASSGGNQPDASMSGQGSAWDRPETSAPSDAEPAAEPDPDAAEWSYQAAYHAMTHDEPRALVAVPLATATVTSWRMPVVGEHLSESWAARYYEGEPRRFRVVAVGKSLDDVKVVPE